MVPSSGCSPRSTRSGSQLAPGSSENTGEGTSIPPSSSPPPPSPPPRAFPGVSNRCTDGGHGSRRMAGHHTENSSENSARRARGRRGSSRPCLVFIFVPFHFVFRFILLPMRLMVGPVCFLRAFLLVSVTFQFCQTYFLRVCIYTYVKVHFRFVPGSFSSVSVVFRTHAPNLCLGVMDRPSLNRLKSQGTKKKLECFQSETEPGDRKAAHRPETITRFMRHRQGRT